MHVTVAPQDLATAWTFDPPVVAALAVGGWLYARGVGTLRRRAGPGRGIAPWRVRCFIAGMVLTGVALVSPMAAAGGATFAAHMLQHMVLMLLAAPLLVLGAPLRVMHWAFRPQQRRWLGAFSRKRWLRDGWHAISHPGTAWALHAIALWVWHLPSLFTLTLTSEAAHAAQHASFFGTALLFWWVVAAPGRSRRLTGMPAVLYIFTTAVQSTALGALLTFFDVPLYPEYARGAALWGLTPLEDQQLAGLLMWVPGGMLYLLAALVVMGVALRGTERSPLSLRT